ncbi:MAG TPA: sugar nucleotide-binding protein [Pyrinomonadaceae bacterium]
MREEPGASPPLELWGGVESTVNRVGESYFDQIEMSGHAERAGDLRLFAELGLRAVRYPVLWERTAPEESVAADWSWPDERLETLRGLALRPIVGLVHHGSGPRHTSLVDPEFPAKLARFAGTVARRYPWVEEYTPVNEPLTTARFSGLYGHWYPHGRDDKTFALALLTQCRAVVLAMRAVRAINPTARLVQTEDLGKTFGTRALSYQAEFENERRWLSFDLLCGRVTPGNPMWNYLSRAGASPDELEWFLENSCPPDVVGVNHYLTSERFLDERLARYPVWSHGGNGLHRYADVEAVRVCAEGPAGPRALLTEAWQRYGIPLAVTEAHLGCTREEQMRWLKEVWDAARQVRDEGADVLAVTAWALLGSHDWDSLVTRADGHYEPGVFDTRSPVPRATALARMLRDLAAGREHEHPLLDTPGWWRRTDRLLYRPARREHGTTARLMPGGLNAKGEASRPLLITGATGTLGSAFARACRVRGVTYRLLSRAEMDIADETSVSEALNELGPWAVVNAAGYVRVDDAEREPERCARENTRGPALLARECARRGVSLLTFSSDLVFDGGKLRPYVEGDATAPLNVYGRSKAEAEALVLQEMPSALLVRTSAFFGPWDEYSFVTAALRALASGKTFAAADDAYVSPTYVPDLVNASLDLLVDGERGVWHLANAGEVTWACLARLAAEGAGFDASLVEGRPTGELGLTARRPLYSVLGSERGQILPSLEHAVSRYLREARIPSPVIRRRRVASTASTALGG